MLDRIIMTNPFVGICHMQVCADKDVTEDEILAFCNDRNPSGTTNGWGYIEHEGDMAPVQCKDDENRMHYLVGC